jgi:hypothetical protein
MSELILVIGNPGTGKSSSMRNLNPEHTFVINVANKPLPFKGYRRNYKPFTNDTKETGNLLNESRSAQIIKVLEYINANRPEINQIIIDDSNYSMAFESMQRVDEVGFKKFTDMGKNMYNLLSKAGSLREDLKVFFFAHEENVGDALNPQRKFKTIGKLVDNVIGVEGLATYVFFTDVREGEDGKMQYKFATQNDGTTTAKTPMGCFEEMYIDNDLALIIEAIDEYNND